MNGRRILPSKEASLQLPNPVPTFRQHQNRVTCQMALELSLVKSLIVKGAEFRCRTAECPDKPELASDYINDEPKPRLLRKLEAILGFALHLRERISRRQEVCVQVVAAARRKGQISGLVGGLKSATQQTTASQEMFRPWHDVAAETRIGPGLEPLQAAFLNEFVTEASESKSVAVGAELRSSYHTKPYIGEARTVTIAVLEAEIDHPTDGKGKQAHISV